MANKTRSTFQKRQKELARQAKRKDKLARRQDAAKQKAEGEPDGPPAETTEDPDLIGIGLGPQPRPDEDDEAEADRGEA